MTDIFEFLMFCHLFHEHSDKRNNNKIWERQKIFAELYEIGVLELIYF